MFGRKKKKQQLQESIKDLEFKDMILPNRMQSRYDRIEFSNGNYVSYVAIKIYPRRTDTKLILKDLGSVKGVSILFDLSELSISTFEKQLSKTVQNEADGMKRKSNVDIVKQGVNEKAQSNFMTELYNNNEKTYKGTVIIKMVAPSIDELNTLCKTVKSKLSARSILADNLSYRQKDAYASFMPFNNNKIHGFIEHPYTAQTFANLWLPNYASWVQAKGFPLGQIENGGAFYFDPFERRMSISNSNGFVVGMSGRGKSFLLKILIFNMVLNGKNVIMLDPNNEFADLVTNLGGQAIPLPLLNVLEIRVHDNELKQEIMNMKDAEISDFKFHLNFLRTWYTTYGTDIENKEDKCFEFLCKHIYAKFNINEDMDYLNLPAHHYPRLRDVYHEAVALSKKRLSELVDEGIIWKPEQFLSVAQTLQTAVLDGSDSQYFDVYTSAPMDLSKQIILAIQLKTINNLKPATKSAIYLNMNNYISALILSDRTTPFLYGWDELHMAVDKRADADNQAIKEFATIYAIARKFEVATWAATTSPQHLKHHSVVDSTTTIFSQCAFKFIFQVVGDDYNHLIEMVSNLNEIVKEKVQLLPRFECISVIGENINFKVKVKGANLNDLQGDEDPYLVEMAQLFGDAGGR
ncbi:helicase HerA domain-containing protein [Erysipelothrix rhusiopathiae]|uniref:helicase HerA domain-containing protein n=1 Tax=Erysipelothrix rhusiopathiae TaxID=1648 RepID=UPI002FBE2902